MTATPKHFDSGAWTVREATVDDVPYLHRRLAGYFGGESIRETRASHERAIRSEPSADDWFAVVYVAEASGQRVGVALGEANDAAAIADGALQAPDRVRTDGRAGYLNFATVAPGYRGRGIHRALVRERVQALAPYVDRFYTVSWVRDDHPDSTETFGGDWLVVDYIEHYYRERSRTYCPDCGRDCECDGIIWTLDAEAALNLYGGPS